MVLALPVAGLAGSAGALFLWSLEVVTRLHWAHPWLLWLLPLAGVAVAWVYQKTARGGVERGTRLIVEEIHQPGGGVPLRMAPLVLLGTLITHLFGGSAGREGTAVQMGGSLAGGVCRWLRLRAQETRRTVLQCGMAAGFGAVFGTPVAGAVFALEVLRRGHRRLWAFPALLVAGYAGDWVCTAWGAQHTDWRLLAGSPEGFSLSPVLVLQAALAGVAFGLAGRLFCTVSHGLQQGLAKWCPAPLWRPALGGALVIALTLALGSRDYLGLGVLPPPGGTVSITTAFASGGADTWSWLWKLLFTAVTLASGFKGGEVTPLFFIGATLGSVLAGWLGAPVPALAALGFVAVFAGAARTPLAGVVMGVELFGPAWTLAFAAACCCARVFSSKAGLYGGGEWIMKNRE